MPAKRQDKRTIVILLTEATLANLPPIGINHYYNIISSAYKSHPTLKKTVSMLKNRAVESNFRLSPVGRIYFCIDNSRFFLHLFGVQIIR